MVVAAVVAVAVAVAWMVSVGMLTGMVKLGVNEKGPRQKGRGSTKR